jgi:DNA-binding GntR family transcriptional regulator
MKTHPTVNSIYKELRQKIVDRSISPGTKLSENLLSKEWNVSRTPIREVLRRLESEGLVTSYPYRGAVVNTITIEDIDQLYTIRISLEGLAGRLAAPVISGDLQKLKALEKLCREMEALFRKGDIEAYIAKNNEFHSLIWHSCGNKWLIKILGNLSSQVNRFIVKALHVPHRIDKSVREHWEIYEKLKIGNGKAVEKAIQNNHKRAFEDLKREFINPI